MFHASSTPHTKLILASLAGIALSAASLNAQAGRAELNGLNTSTTFDRFIVKYRNESAAKRNTQSLQQSLDGFASKIPVSRGKRTGLHQVRRMLVGADVIRADRKLDRVDARNLMNLIAADPNVEYVEIDVAQRPMATTNDPLMNTKWEYGTTAAATNIMNAWNHSTGTGMVVAVIDSGKIAHEDLNANYVGGYDFIADTTNSGDSDGRDANATDSSGNEHGTRVAGIIGAVGNNNLGFAGVAFGAKIVPLRVVGQNGKAQTSDIVDAIIWASGGTVAGIPANPNKAQVINISLGEDIPCMQSYQSAINTAVANGSVVVVSAGNLNKDASNSMPANCTNTIAVAATDVNGNRAYYSNYGTTIDISAPAGELCAPSTEFLPLGQSPVNACTSTSATQVNSIITTGTPPSLSYRYFEGTSAAAPHVSGIIALMQSVAFKPWSPADVLTILKNTARPISAAKCPGGCGAGLIDAEAAVRVAANRKYTNATDYLIPDNGTISSPITISGRVGNGFASTSVSVLVQHQDVGDIKLELIAPSGTAYLLQANQNHGATSINKTYSVNLSNQPLNGTWKLRATDVYSLDVGYIDSWSITL